MLPLRQKKCLIHIWGFQKQKNYVTRSKVQVRDVIGPADAVSNLHPIKYVVKENETPLETKLRKHREEVQEWNQLFWTKHNKSFAQAKKNFEVELLKNKRTEDQTLTADEMSIFYKKFLDDNWPTHMRYLLSWYKKNFYLTFLHFSVLIENLILRKR